MNRSHERHFAVVLIAGFLFLLVQYANAIGTEQSQAPKEPKNFDLLLPQDRISLAGTNDCLFQCDLEYAEYKVKKCCKPNPQFEFGFKKQNYMTGKSKKTLCFEVLPKNPTHLAILGK